MKTKIIGIVVVLALAGGIWLVAVKTDHPTSNVDAAPSLAATPVGEKQTFEVVVKEGYQPREIAAKAGVPVILKMKTSATFDCSTAFNIPKLNIHVHLQPTGETDIEIPAQQAGDSVSGVCSMGMYSLVIKFS